MVSESTRNDGVLASWNDERGFGFITADDGQRVFAHISAFPRRNIRPTLGEQVSFIQERTSDTRVRARSIRYPASAQAPVRRSRQHRGTVGHIVAAIFAVALAVATTTGTIPWWAAVLYAVMSVVSYLAYAADKSAAHNRQWRVSENTLLGLGLVGGWPGSIIAQQRLRHKTQKTSFRRAFAVSVVLNVVTLVVVGTPLRDPVLAGVRLFLSTIAP